MKDVFHNEVELTEERWKHIIKTHPEMEPHRGKVSETLSEPDTVKRSKRDENIQMHYKWYDDVLSGKYILVVVKCDGRSFIVTAYITDQIKQGDVLWKKS